MGTITIIAILAYLLGSFPTAILVGKWSRGIDIRQHGSGNAGGTNVFRVLGWKLGVFVMLVDMLKGLAATVFISQITWFGTPELSENLLKIVAGTFAIVGHIWTIFAGFKGGKGVGTAAGFLFGLIPIAATVGLVVFFTIFFLTRYVSLGSMVAAVSIPSTLLFQRFFLAEPIDPILITITVLLAALIIFTHRSNIGRLIKGTENRISNLKGGSQ